MATTVLLDVDGTLVDSNYQHALSWYRALRRHQLVVPVYRIHRHIGMGGDQLVPALAGESVGVVRGDAIRSEEEEIYRTMLEEVACFQGARALIEALRDRGHRIVFATSARQHELDHYLDLLDARRLVDAWTTSADVAATKPHPDLVLAGMAKVGADRAIMVGDSAWDVKAAERASVPCIGILTGGFSKEELQDAGAVAVFESVGELNRRLDETPLAR